LAKQNKDTGFVNSYIGEGTTFQGDLALSGILRIDGDFIGSIQSEGKVILGATGRAKCSIHARQITIGGVFKGDIYCSEKVTLLSSGLVIGKIFAPRLEAEAGVLIDGTCTITPLPGKEEDLTSHGYKIQKGGYFSLDWEQKKEPTPGYNPFPQEESPRKESFPWKE